jgi:hypothetical protein
MDTEKEANQTSELTPEEIEHWLNEKGSIPRAIRSQIAVIRRKNKIAKTNKIYKETTKGIVQRDKLELFLKEFVQNGGNATQAALTIGNYSTIQSASVAGHNFLKRAKGLSRIYLEKRGYTYGKLLDIATQKMETSKTPDWWDRIMKMADYADFISKKEERPNVVNIVQAQRDLQKAFGFGEVIEGEEANGDADNEEEL